MKKPSKEQREIWAATYAKKNKEQIKQKRRKINPDKRSSSDFRETQSEQIKKTEVFYKSHFGKKLIKQLKKVK
jgi:hypothetical protein